MQQLSKTDYISPLYRIYFRSQKRKIDSCELLKYQHDFKHTNMMQYSLHCFIMDQYPKIKADIDVMKAAFN